MKGPLPLILAIGAGFGAGWFLKPAATAPAADLPAVAAAPTATTPAPPPAPGAISINSATSEELQAIPGIGPVLAGRIIEYRTTYGPFASIDELANVKGIGEKTLAKMRPHITL